MALTSPDVMVAKFTALGHEDVKVLQRSEQAGLLSVRTRRGVPMDVPAYARRYFGPVTMVEQHEDWDPIAPDGSRSGIWQVSARGVPVTTGGQLRLSPAPDGGTLVEVSGEVVCPMPFVGGKIAAFVGADVERTMGAEAAFLDGYLREQSGERSAEHTRRRKAS